MSALCVYFESGSSRIYEGVEPITDQCIRAAARAGLYDHRRVWEQVVLALDGDENAMSQIEAWFYMGSGGRLLAEFTE